MSIAGPDRAKRRSWPMRLLRGCLREVWDALASLLWAAVVIAAIVLTIAFPVAIVLIVLYFLVFANENKD